LFSLFFLFFVVAAADVIVAVVINEIGNTPDAPARLAGPKKGVARGS